MRSRINKTFVPLICFFTKSKKYVVNISITLVIFANTLSSQVQSTNCYINLGTTFGITSSEKQLGDLKAAACALVQVLPAEIQQQFRVYDFGFYLLQESYVGGLPDIFRKKLKR